MKKYVGLAVLSAFVAGCKAHMIETHGANLQLARRGLVQPPKGGAIKYLVTGSESMKKARKADAEKQMRSYCGGDYTVSAEGSRKEVGNAVPVGDKSSLDVGQFHYIAFECAKR